MESKKNQNVIVKIVRVAWTEYIQWLCSPRMVVFFSMLFFIYYYAAQPLIQHAINMNDTLGAFEIFIAVGNSKEMAFVMPAVFLVLMSDYPKIDGNSYIHIIRVGRYCWYLGQICMGVMAVVTFIIGVMVSCCLMGTGYITFSNQWSDVVTKYYQLHPEETMNYITRFITGRLYNNFKPMETVGYTASLLVGYFLILCMIKIICFFWHNRQAGVVVCGSLIAVGGALLVANTRWRWLFPMSHAIGWQHCDELLRTMEVTMSQSYLYFIIVIFALFLYGVTLAEKYRF